MSELCMDQFAKGIEEFNSQQFFDCHETLEALWTPYSGPERELIQAIIQIAVAYYHLGRENHIGALKLFDRAMPRLNKYKEPTASTLGVDVASLSQAVQITINECNQLQTGHKVIGCLPKINFVQR